MIARGLRRIVLACARLFPGDPRTTDDLITTIEALADEARAAGGPAAERAYLSRELADILRHAWAARGGRAAPARLTARQLATGLHDDLRASGRQWRRQPMATIAVVGTLALAVAAVITTFGLVTAVLWRPLPFPAAERLVFVWESAADERAPFRTTSGRFFEWQQDAGAFESMALFGAAGFSLESTDGAVPVRGLRVSTGYFTTLGVRPLLGRGFETGDEVPGAPPVVILSEAMWRGRFGGAADVIGRDVRLGGEPRTVVGVMPALVTPGWPSNPARVAVEAELRQFWIPISRTPEFVTSRRAHVFGVVARLRDGATRAQADAELGAPPRPDDPDRHHGATMPFRDQFVRDVRGPLLVLFAAAVAVLLVACANLAALQVSRFEQRRNDLAIRAALGAGRIRLAGLLLVDAVLLSLAGGSAGVWLSSIGLAWIPTRLPPTVPFLTTPRIDIAGAAVGCAIGLVVAGALGFWPVLRLRSVSSTPRGAVRPGRPWVYRGLVAAQVAVGVTLAVPAALLGESLSSVRARDPGFVVDGVTVVDVSLAGPGPIGMDRAERFDRALTGALAALPGVAGAALAYDHPLAANWTEVIAVRGETPADPGSETDAQLRIVSPSYFDALGVRVLDGRSFDESEDTSRPGVVLVNEAFAAAHGGRIIGRHLRSSAAAAAWGAAAPVEYQIVGVIENERFRGLELPSAPAIYLSTRQFPQTSAVLLVRAAAGAADLPSRLRGIVRTVEPAATIGEVRTLGGILADQLVSRRVTSSVTGVFAAATVGLALLGLYGLMALTVASRTRDVGVRLALGASRRDVALSVIGESVGAAAVGIATGAALTLAVGGVLEHLLVDVSARDPLTMAMVATVVLIGAVLAAALPARRAATVDPVIALRAET